MLSYTLKRILGAIPTVFVVITVCFVMLQLTPGGPFDRERKVSPEVLANLQAKYHLNEPVYKQFGFYLNNLLHGDLGASFRYADWSVNSLVANALPYSLTVGGTAMLLSIVIGVLLGITAALKQNSLVDYFVMFLGNFGSAVPSFIIGPVMILVFCIWAKALPFGEFSLTPAYLILPVALLTLINVATLGRMMRGSLIEVMHSNFIRTAKAKGLPLRVIVLRHALKPALLPVVTVLGPLAVSSVAQAVVTETMFAIPGVGRLLVNGAINRDYTLVLGLVVLVAVMTVLFNLIVDIIYATLDPRIRY
ncbi:MAG: ABC transporter permease subunit [Paludibacterium sp.]|uniref:ABC transporter permease subunit n=1 Tax=Paludibacterium sp. TaxID=1917523 RepID=UPI0025DB5A6C|nr:ABC transporter permease subunit [Paludibacterium sp.]MBV8046223.1 ABC transporter permease subunit [Paludibacterium sp.]MBV8647809.1 ABC transporter permease subunit [Paludibacterium sp.]